MIKAKGKITTFANHLDEQYGKRGTVKREKYEQEFETFKIGVIDTLVNPRSKGENE